jgi:NitT/TauT family transport system substrate-binding protein
VRRKGLAMWIAIAVFMMILLPACSSGKDEVSKVRLGEVTRSIFYAPEYVAMNEGFFKDEGLEVELQTIPGGDKTMTALLSNAIDVALVGSETSIYVAQQGSDDPVINFHQLTQTDGTFLVSRKPIDSFDWNTLKGSTFLGQRKGGMPQMAGEFALKKHGIDPHKDLTLIQNIEFANIASAFSSGTGDYVQLFEPQASIMEKEGKGKVIASFGKESGLLPYTVFMTKQSFLDKNSSTVQKFSNAIQKAQKWVDSNSVEDVAKSIASFFPNTDQAIMESVVKRYKEQSTYAINGIIDESEWNNLLSVMEAAGELKSKVDWSKIVNNSYAEKAEKNVK